MKKFEPFGFLTMALSLLLGMSGCAAVHARALSERVTPGDATGKEADDKFINGIADFSVELFKKSITNDKNSLVSPLSVALALGMTANGTNGDTLSQFETLFGGIPLSELNEYMLGYVRTLSGDAKSKLDIANSIWFRDDKAALRVEDAFLQTNADYYGAGAFNEPFNQETVKKINEWVNTKTDGMINEILNEINTESMLYLINAVAFDAEWQKVYYKDNIDEGEFTDYTGTIINAEFRFSMESQYLEDELATGFIKDYAGGRYAFAALLPKEGVSIDDYIESLTGTGLIKTLQNASSESVHTTLPKFNYAYDIKMNDALKALGIPNAFDAGMADFTKMGTSEAGPLYIDTVLHKTFISVDELGTKAGAVTMVAMFAGGAMEYKTVRLDRPFVYAIIDTATKLPVFIGTVLTAGE
jgi:serpin B